MRNLKLKFFTVLLSIIYVLSMIPAAVTSAATIASGICGENIIWTLDDSGTLTLSGSGEMDDYYSDYSIPWYEYRDSIKSVLISKSITSIGDGAFWNCTSLKNVTIPNSVSEIGHVSFMGCSCLTSVVMPDSITSIGSQAFDGCSSLTDLTISSGVTYIDQNTFAYCTSLTNISIPKSVNIIDHDAFCFCTKLENVNIPDSVTRIESSTFEGCDSITEIKYGGSRDQWNSIGGKVLGIPYERVHCVTDVTLPKDVIGYAGDEAEFSVIANGTGVKYQWQTNTSGSWGNSSLPGAKTATLSVPITKARDRYKFRCVVTDSNGRTATSESATLYFVDTESRCCGDNLTWTFDDTATLTISGSGDMDNWNSDTLVPWYSYRDAIKSVVFSGSITSIGDYAFYNCTNLRNITIPDSVISIGSYAFCYCTGFTSVKIPGSVTSMGSYAFAACTNLTSVIISNGLTSINDGAFYSCIKLTNVNMPDSVSSIGNSSFRDCENLYSINLPKGLSSIGKFAFKDCFELNTIKIPRGVTNIKDQTFSGCQSMHTVTLPDSITSISYSAFFDANSYYYDENGNLVLKNQVYELGYYGTRDQFEQIGITDTEFFGVTDVSIYDIFPNAYFYLDQKVSIRTQPEDFTGFVGSTATFTVQASGCGLSYQWQTSSTGTWVNSSLQGAKTATLSVPITKAREKYKFRCIVTDDFDYAVTSDVVSINLVDCASGACGDNLTWTLDNNGILTISGSGDMCDWGYSCPQWLKYAEQIRSVVFNGNITSIGNCSFYGCVNLTDISIPYSVKTIGDSAFSGCRSLTNINISESVTEIGSNAFSGCTSITDITIPDGVTVIGDYAFSNCTNLKSVTLSSNLSAITKGTFSRCANLTNISIPISVSSFGSGAFYGCQSLKSITIPTSQTEIGAGTFAGCSSLTSITIPSNVTVIGVSAFAGCTGLSSITIPNNMNSIGSSAFSNCTNLKSIFIPGNVSSIGSGCFSGCSSLTSINLPKDIISIGGYTFAGCISLKNLTVPDRVTSIGYGAFYDCSSLKTITIPASVTVFSIRGEDYGDGKASEAAVGFADYNYKHNYHDVFDGCTSLTDVYYGGTQELFEAIEGHELLESSTIIIHYGSFSVAIKSNPKDFTGRTGETATFSVAANGTGLNYQWQTNSNGTWINSSLPGAKTPTLSVPIQISRDGYKFRCVVTGSNKQTAASNSATLNVITVEIIDHPYNFTGMVGDTATFTVSASGTGLQYQWQTNSSGTWINSSLSGSKTATLSVPIIKSREGYRFRCVVTDKYNHTATSGSARIRIGQPIVITKQPKDFTGQVGSTATFNIVAQGEDISYYWYSLDDRYLYISNSYTSEASITVSEEDDGARLCCEIYDRYGSMVKSNIVTIHIGQPPLSITGQPSDYTGSVGGTATFKVTASGTGLKYQWQTYSNGKWVNSSLTGATTATLSVPVINARNGYKFRCTVTDAGNNKATSNAAILHVVAPLTITNQPSDYSGTVGETAVFNVTAQGTGLTYQWQTNSSGTWKNSSLSGYNTDTLSVGITNSRNGYKFRCVVKNSNNQTVTSNEVTLYVTTPVVITTQPKDYSGSVGSTAEFKVIAQGTGLKYQWQAYSNGKWVNSSLTGATTATLSVGITASRDGYKYRCIVTDAGNNTVTSNPATLLVVAPVKITDQPSDYTGSVGSTAEFKVTAQGTGLKYQWQTNSSGTWKNSSLPGSSTAILSVPITNARNGYQFRCVVTDKSGATITSNAVTLYVELSYSNSVEGVSISSPSSLGCVEAETEIQTADLELMIDIEFNTDESIDKELSIETPEIEELDVGAVDENQSEIIVTSEGEETDCCADEGLSDSTLIREPTIVVQPEIKKEINGNKITLTTEVEGNGLMYRWQIFKDGEWIDLETEGSDEAELTLEFEENLIGQQYRCEIKDLAGNIVITDVVIITDS